jgi:hypothetical protein
LRRAELRQIRSAQLADATIAAAFLFVGVLILMNLDALTEFDQRSGLRMHSWFKRKLGPDSTWNREIYSVGTPSGHKKSRVGFTAVGVLCVLAGFILFSLVLMSYLR